MILLPPNRLGPQMDQHSRHLAKTKQRAHMEGQHKHKHIRLWLSEHPEAISTWPLSSSSSSSLAAAPPPQSVPPPFPSDHDCGADCDVDVESCGKRFADFTFQFRAKRGSGWSTQEKHHRTQNQLKKIGKLDARGSSDKTKKLFKLPER